MLPRKALKMKSLKQSLNKKKSGEKKHKKKENLEDLMMEGMTWTMST